MAFNKILKGMDQDDIVRLAVECMDEIDAGSVGEFWYSLNVNDQELIIEMLISEGIVRRAE